MNKISKIALIDDHVLFRKGLSELIQEFPDFEVLYEADNGQDLVSGKKPIEEIDIAVLDIHMPKVDGIETCSFIKEHYPGIKILALSMMSDDESIIRMIRAGANGYILKDAHPLEFRNALNSILAKGCYYCDVATQALVGALNTDSDVKITSQLNERERKFLQLAATELTYKEIADTMFVSPRTVDGYREALFKKLNVKSRVGLVLFSIQNDLA